VQQKMRAPRKRCFLLVEKWMVKTCTWGTHQPSWENYIKNNF